MVLDVEQLRFGHRHPSSPLIQLSRFSMAPGEKVLLYGPSGCGKSTLLALLSGIRPLQQGRVHILGEPFSELSQRRRDAFRADHIGVIFQAFNLLPYLSAVDNVCLAAGFSRHRRQREQATSRRDVLAVAHQLLLRLGLDGDTLSRPVWQLSFGQQQRVAAARALFGKPPLIIADEPTSALDDASRDALMAVLTEQCQQRGSALLMVSHDRHLARHVDRSLAFADLNRNP